MGLEAAGEARALNGVLSAVHVSLHTGVPTGANEVVGGSYARQPYAYALTGSNPTVAGNTGVIQFPVATGNWGTLTHFGIWTASSGGSLVGWGVLDVSKSISTDDIARFPIDSLKVQVD